MCLTTALFPFTLNNRVSWMPFTGKKIAFLLRFFFNCELSQKFNNAHIIKMKACNEFRHNYFLFFDITTF